MNRSISSSSVGANLCVRPNRTRRFFRAVMTAAIVGSLMMFACGDDDDDDGGKDSGKDGGKDVVNTTANTFTLNNAPPLGTDGGSIIVNIFAQEKTITATGFTWSIWDPKASVDKNGKIVWLTNENATYNVLVNYYTYTDGDIYKFQNNVKFTDGSATLDWNTMEVATGVEIDYSGI